jgi:hypothetical protein
LHPNSDRAEESPDGPVLKVLDDQTVDQFVSVTVAISRGEEMRLVSARQPSRAHHGEARDRRGFGPQDRRPQ